MKRVTKARLLVLESMTYKGYLGSVAYSEKDQVFFGKINDINAIANLWHSIRKD